MGALLFKILFLAVASVLGAVAGWWIRGTGLAKEQPQADPSNEPSPPKEEPKIDAVETLMAQLQQLTATVAADVGEHNTRVREINAELTDATASGTNVVNIVERLVKANESMQSQLKQAEDRLQEQSREIETHVHEARTDALTKIWNRRHFDDEMKKCSQALASSQRPSCMMMLDVDYFKKFNDTYGHQAGDEVLKGVARTLRKSVTAKEHVCRYGGEEFAIIFPGSDLTSAKVNAERARAAIAEQVFEFEGLDLKVTASGGLAQLEANETTEECVRRADDALYVCKEDGRNCGYWHDGEACHPLEATELQAHEDEQVPTESDQAEDRQDCINGLSRRKSFINDVDRRVAEWKRGGAPVSVLLVEVDKYTMLTEEYGEKAAEVVLRAASQFLKAAMREMDHIARYDDHVFGLLLPGAEIAEAVAVAERLRAAIARCSLPLDDTKVTFTVSLGAAQVHGDDECADLLKRAHESLAMARKAGGNCSFAAAEDGEIRSMELSS